MEPPRTLPAMAEPQGCLARLLAAVSRSKAWHKHSAAVEEVVLMHLAQQRWRMAFLVCQRCSHTVLAPPGSLRAVTAIKTSGSIRMFASPEIYHISSPRLQGVRFTPALRTHNLSWLNSFLGKVDLHRPQPRTVKCGCRRAWRLLSPAPRLDAEHSESFSHGDYVAESPARALNPAVSSGHDGPWQNVTWDIL